eukprot:403355834
MRTIAFTLMVSAYALSTAFGKATWEKSGPDYEKFSAAEKKSQLWEQIISNQTPSDWFSPLALAGIFAESMMPSLKWVGDTFENGWLGVRSKYIHTVGNTATCKWTPVSNSEGYTGIFKSGSDHGIIRLSAAKQPDYTKTKATEALDNFMPGFGLKFLRDGVSSGNLVAMYGVDGAESWNFFKMDFSNHIPDPISTPQKILGKKFATGTPFIQYVGLSDIATYDQHGVKTDNPKFPFQLVFVPTLRDNYSDDFSEIYQSHLDKVPQGTLLYKVYAHAEPDAPRVHIADLSITSKLMRSNFGDKYLFFKHQDMQEDIALRPEWKSHLKVGSSRCPVSFVKEVASDLFSQILSFVFKGAF